MMLPDDATENTYFVPLTSDHGFKSTFGNERNTLFLRRALQALIRSETPIAKVTLIKTEQTKLLQDSRGGIYDLACRDADGRYFIVEMQLAEAAGFLQRMKFYTLYRLNALLRRGTPNFDHLPPVYCIGLLNFVIWPQLPDYYQSIALRTEAGVLVDEQATYITVELPKFTKSLEELTSDLDKLLYTMKTAHTLPANKPDYWPVIWNEDWIRLAFDELDRLKMDPEERIAYEMAIVRNASIVFAANERRERERTEALSEGREEGIEQGREQGREEGRRQAVEASIQRALRRGKLTVAEIAEDHGVALAEVLLIQAKAQ